MAATISLAEAAAALHDMFDVRLDASKDEGHRILANALQKHFSISGREARKLVEELEQARTIRYRPAHQTGGSPNVSASSYTPVAMAGGYWQIGHVN
jgi:HD superfamily phosphodiesterase